MTWTRGWLPLILLVSGVSGAAAAPPPVTSLRFEADPEGQLVIRGSAASPGLLDLEVHPVDDPGAGLHREVVLPGGGEAVRLRPPRPGVYQVSASLRTLSWGPPRAVASRGAGPGRVREPAFLASSLDGDLVVTDRANRRLQVLTATGRYRFGFGASEFTGSGSEPAGVAAAPNGRLYVVDSLGGRVLRFSPQGRPLGEATLERAMPRPGGLAVIRNQDLLLALPREDSVLLLDSQGRVRRQLGGFGTAPGRLRGPEDVATVDSSSFWVSESGNARVQHLQLSGDALGVIQGELRAPAGLDLGPRGLLYVADRGTRSVHVLDPAGGELMQVGHPTLGDPVDVAAMPDGSLFVSDRRRSTIWLLPSTAAVTYRTGQVSLESVR